MKLGEAVESLMGMFRDRYPVIEVATEIFTRKDIDLEPKLENGVEINIVFQKSPASITNGELETIKRLFAWQQYGEGSMIHVGINVDERLYVCFDFVPDG